MIAPSKKYFPCVTIREGECRAVANLASPTKDLVFPIVRLQAWPRSKAGEGGPIERSLKIFGEAFGERAFALDLALPRTDLDSDWAQLGHDQISKLHSSADGFKAWCDLLATLENVIPVIQWDPDPENQLKQLDRLTGFGRGIVLRLKRSQNWNLDKLSALAGRDLSDTNILLIFDCEQIEPQEDLTVIGTMAQNAILSAEGILNGGQRYYALTGSSFPSSFADIHPEYASLPIRERQLFDLLKLSPPITQAGIALEYGDHCSVYAAERPSAFRGAPRVDYPTTAGWIYHRSKDSFDAAAKNVRNDPQWDEDLLCWGAQRIRTAAGGDMTGLNSQSPWVAIRINIHLHRQAHAGGEWNNSIEEDWVD